jgi:hypothetical protein
MRQQQLRQALRELALVTDIPASTSLRRRRGERSVDSTDCSSAGEVCRATDLITAPFRTDAWHRANVVDCQQNR